MSSVLGCDFSSLARCLHSCLTLFLASINGGGRADLDQMRRCLRLSVRLSKIGEPPAYTCAGLYFCYTEDEMRKQNLFKEDKVKAI